MEVREIDPSVLEIDPLNERQNNVGPHKGDNSLEDSVRTQGLIQPPIVRRSDGTYKVIVGQRRTLAAQSVGLETIPVVIVDWDDAEALEASITENVDAFRKSVPKKDRSAAIRRLMELNSWSVRDTAEELGISPSTINDWIERTREEWEDTVVHVDPDEPDTNDEERTTVETHETNSTKINHEDVDRISDTDLRAIRNLTDNPEERQRAVEKVVNEGVTQSQIREAKKRTERGEGSFEEVVEKVSKQSSNEEASGSIQVRTEVTFTGEYAKGLQSAARDKGTSEEEVVRGAIAEYLRTEGYL